MTLPMMIRLAIPLFVALASATLFFRALVLLLIAMAFMALLVLVVRRVGGGPAGKPRGTGRSGRSDKGYVEGSYRIVDDRDEQSS